MKKLTSLFVWLALSTTLSFAQESVVATGCDSKNDQGASVGISVGQLAVETYSNSSNAVLLGIQQDFSVVDYAISTKPIPNQDVKMGDIVEINLDEYFVSTFDFSYSVLSSDESVVRPVLAGSVLSFELLGQGTATITVTATNLKGDETPQTFEVSVDNAGAAITTIAEVKTEISVVGHTIYISNMHGEQTGIFDVAGKRVYSCKDMENAMVTIRTTGTYVVKIGNAQQNVIIKN